MDEILMEGGGSKKRKIFHDDDDDEEDIEEKMEKFFAIVRSIKEGRDHIKLMEGGGGTDGNDQLRLMIKEDKKYYSTPTNSNINSININKIADKNKKHYKQLQVDDQKKLNGGAVSKLSFLREDFEEEVLAAAGDIYPPDPLLLTITNPASGLIYQTKQAVIITTTTTTTSTHDHLNNITVINKEEDLETQQPAAGLDLNLSL